MKIISLAPTIAYDNRLHTPCEIAVVEVEMWHLVSCARECAPDVVAIRTTHTDIVGIEV